jgi:hypothetical protein
MHTCGRGLQRENGRKRSQKSGTGEGGLEKKIQRQGGKCRGEEGEWRRNKIDRSRFLEGKRRYRERCREKKKQKREREKKEIKEIRIKKEVRKYINRESKKKESVNEKITMQETAGREKGRRRGRNTNKEEANGAGGNRNHSGRGGKTDKESKKEKGTGEGRSAE